MLIDNIFTINFSDEVYSILLDLQEYEPEYTISELVNRIIWKYSKIIEIQKEI